MPKKAKGSKGKKGKKGGKRKGKKDKKKKEEPAPPPLHDLTKLYNQLVEEVEGFKASRNNARKKRIEAWYMTREMMSLRHDQEVYHKRLAEKMEDLENFFAELTKQLNEEREAVERIIKARMEEMDRIIAGYKERSVKAEALLHQLKQSLLEFEPMMRELAGLMNKLRELQALIPVYELEANIKTRHLKNQYLMERSKLHNHLESELYKLITTCRSHLMPILSDHMSSMELENRCSRWELGVLDEKNFRLYRERETLLEKRNHLNMEREYLNIDWAFNKLAQMEARKKGERQTPLKGKRMPTEVEEECELAIAFRTYLSTKLGDIERAKERERRAKARREARERKQKREAEKKKRAEILAKKRAEAKAGKLKKGILGPDTDEEEFEDELDEWGELEYYEDDEGNWVIATPSRMLQHKAILENKAMDEIEQQVEDIKHTIAKKKKDAAGGETDHESSSSSSGSSAGSSSSSSWSGESEGSLASLTDLDDDEDDDDDDGEVTKKQGGVTKKKAGKQTAKQKKKAAKKKDKNKDKTKKSEYGFGDYDDFGDTDNFGGFDD